VQVSVAKNDNKKNTMNQYTDFYVGPDRVAGRKEGEGEEQRKGEDKAILEGERPDKKSAKIFGCERMGSARGKS